MKLPKMVRDMIPSIIEKDGKKCSYRKAKKDEVSHFLYRKIEEEVLEFIEKPSAEEAADIYEVFLCMLRNHGIDFSSVVNHAYHKRVERGSFERHFILEAVD